MGTLLVVVVVMVMVMVLMASSFLPRVVMVMHYFVLFWFMRSIRLIGVNRCPIS